MADKPNSASTDTVDTPSTQYNWMVRRWELPEALMGGTDAMRKAGTKYLPRETKEPYDAYQVRLERSFLYGAYEDTIDKIVAKPFTKPVDVQGLDARMRPVLKDMDGNDSSITDFGAALFYDLVHFGKYHIFVDYTRIDQNRPGMGRPMSIAEERRAGARPVFVRMSPKDVIGWRVRRDEAGQKKLSQLRVRETRVEPKGKFGDTSVEYVRVYEVPEGGGNVVFSLWKKDDETDTYVLVPDEVGSMTINYIPLVTGYADPGMEFMVSVPPMGKLAELNLAHWQSESDQRNILRVSRFAVLFFKGLTKEEAEEEITLGPFNSIRSSSPDADGKYIEHSGSAIQSGERDIAALERRMEVMGLQPLVESGQNSTATGKMIDEGRGLAPIQRWIRALERGLYEAFVIAYEWLRLGTPPEDFLVNVYSDFAMLTNRTGDLDFLLRTLVAGKMTVETFWVEVARRGLMSDTFNPEAEAESVSEELDLGLITSDRPDPLTPGASPGLPAVQPPVDGEE